MFIKTLFIALSLVPSLVSAGLFHKNGPVQVLTGPDDFKATLSEERAAIVLFFAPWCGHCKQLGPEYIKAATALGPLVPFYAIDCDEAINSATCARYEVKGFPTIKTFPRGLKGVVHDYNGERKAASIVEYLNGDVPNKVTVIKGGENVQAWIDKDPTITHALLLTSKSKTPLQWKVLQQKFGTKVSFAALKDADGSIARGYNVDSKGGTEPVVLVWAPGFPNPEIYMGEKKYEPLVDFITAATLHVYDPSKNREEL